ncbi:MAG: pinensin family lanthipeptide [Cyclobacteriaceae bacterium]
MKKQKLSLDNLRVESFVTEGENFNGKTIKGGGTSFQCSWYNCTINHGCPDPEVSGRPRECPDWTAYDWCNTDAC